MLAYHMQCQHSESQLEDICHQQYQTIPQRGIVFACYSYDTAVGVGKRERSDQRKSTQRKRVFQTYSVGPTRRSLYRGSTRQFPLQPTSAPRVRDHIYERFSRADPSFVTWEHPAGSGPWCPIACSSPHCPVADYGSPCPISVPAENSIVSVKQTTTPTVIAASPQLQCCWKHNATKAEVGALSATCVFVFSSLCNIKTETLPKLVLRNKTRERRQR
ncbi:hypothetical protein EYF80_003462 [Liparis tanakae]|uniref:Uncharacterized protein n=1 Tax=Liparis tanakae TaxID=230148 RepID=A0A4Z2J8N3_9TELE|nr:hypothetical protein EYF80_003462 [Liparis tanakae]